MNRKAEVDSRNTGESLLTITSKGLMPNVLLKGLLIREISFS